MDGRERWVVEVVEQPQLLFEQEGAVEAAVGGLDVGERGELVDRLVLGRFELRPAGALDPAAGWRLRALVSVPFVADLVGRAAGEAAHVPWVKADLGVRDGLAEGALVFAAHVDRDGADGALAVAELGEELIERGAVAPRPAPHDRAAGVVGDRGQ